MNSGANKRTLTLLVEDLRPLIDAVKADRRFTALETVLSRGDHFNAQADSPDHFRFQLFGMEADGQLPVAALTRAGDFSGSPAPDRYWLRTDPVTLWADMARVVVTGHGLADLDAYERNEIENTIRSVLLQESIELHADHPERWCIALEEPVGSNFTPLGEALGMDLAEAMQENPESKHWRRIMNEIEIALHSCPVNSRRRQAGLQQINSVWFWGGGFLPDASGLASFDTVYSDQPVSRGLASIHDCRLHPQDAFSADRLCDDGQSILIDWTVNPAEPEVSLGQLETLVGTTELELRANTDELLLYCGRRDGWRFNRKSKRRFWRRIRTLDDLCNQRFPA